MVKLIRLSANDTNVIRNDLQTNVIIKKKSKIALLNLSFEKSKIIYEINRNNNEFFYQIGDFTAQPKISSQKLEEENYIGFLDDIGAKFNETLDASNEFTAGTRWFFIIDTQNYFKGVNVVFPVENPFNSDYYKQSISPPQYIQNGVDGTFGKPGTSTTFDSGWGVIDDNIVNFPDVGCGYFRCAIQTLTASGTGFWIGICNTDIGSMAKFTFEDNDNIIYGIKITTDGDNYQYKSPDNAVIQDAGFKPENHNSAGVNNDILSIESTLGKINLTIYNASNPDGKILISHKYTGADYLIPCFSFGSSEFQCSMRDLQLTIDDSRVRNRDLHPGTLPTQLNYIQPRTLNLLETFATTLNPPKQTNENRKPMYFEFPSLSFARYLGFNNKDSGNLAGIGTEQKFLLVAPNSVTFRDQSEAYLVETLNLKLDSYDGLLEQRKDILMIIQNARDRTKNDVLFEANNLIYVDINNDFEFSLRNVDIALKKTNYENVDIIGELIMTLLIKEENEL